jgi:catechol 2,3-dioxygenase-like lactoylglutathione lyase family enzyme
MKQQETQGVIRGTAPRTEVASLEALNANWRGVLGGVHHTARPTWRLADTVRFYRDVMGLPLVHAISAKGWGIEGHGDFLHFFFDSGRGSTIAFFYYLGTDMPEQEAPRADHYYTATHTAWAVESTDELVAWRTHLEGLGVQVSAVTQHEVIQSIYCADPNGYPVEITCQSRGYSAGDAEDARRTIDAALAAEERAALEHRRVSAIEEIWRVKGESLLEVVA